MFIFVKIIQFMTYKKQGLYLPEFEHDNCGAGFICSLNGEKTNKIIHEALEILAKLEHRGAVSSDGKTGDGAGILIDIPFKFFTKVCDFKLPKPKEYAVGMIFLPQNTNQYNYCIKILKEEITNQGLNILGWRDVPVKSEHLGKIAAKSEPKIKQLFVGKNKQELTDFKFNAKVFSARKIAEHKINDSKLRDSDLFYIPSFSNKTLIYKGLLIPEDIRNYYTDLSNPNLITRLALVHQRFSTNTSPSWDLAQPFRFMCHNGEINTLRGNVSRMRAREELMKSEVFGKEIKEIFPVILKGKSDSAAMDMVVEMLLMTGRTLPEVMMMMVPEAWEKDNTMPDNKKAFYEYSSCVMEPWDGPASVPFTDGNYIGALLDRNGLRPSRYSVTKSGYVVMSSEIGVLDIKPENIVKHGRLEPGKMFLVDMNEGRIIEDEEIKNKITSKYPYREWLNDNLLSLSDVPYTGNACPIELTPYKTRQRMFGYTKEDIDTIIVPMSKTGKETLGSMGTDTPLAVLSDKPQLLYNYFKQLFAQVTNPPLDGIREEIITDISLAIGEDRNIFKTTPEHCKKLKIQNPVVSNNDLDKIRNIDHPDFKSCVIPILYDIKKGLNSLEKALDNMVATASNSIDNGCNIIILSDRNADIELGPIPPLLACSYLHHSLNDIKKRSKIGIIIESAEPREPHHFATLFGYGASGVNPYMVNEIIREKVRNGTLVGIDSEKAVQISTKPSGKES